MAGLSDIPINPPFVPGIRWNALAGHFHIADKDAYGQVQPVVIPKDTEFTIDCGSAEWGPLMFGKNGPVRRMVPCSEPLPDLPDDRDSSGDKIYKTGIRLMIAGHPPIGVRELLSSTIALLKGVRIFWDQYEASPEAWQGKI